MTQPLSRSLVVACSCALLLSVRCGGSSKSSSFNGGGAAGVTGTGGAAASAGTGGASGGGTGVSGAGGAAGANNGGNGGAGGVNAGGSGGVGGPCTTDQACYSGTAQTRNVNACHDGVAHCIGGVLGPCIGEVLPSAEACNGIDDDCDGTPDNGLGTLTCGVGACARPASGSIQACVGGQVQTCIPGTLSAEICGNNIDENCNGIADDGCACVHVAPPCTSTNTPAGCVAAAADTATCGSASAPCATIQYAISSIAGVGANSSMLCVASRSGCTGTAVTHTYAEAVTMKNGVSVFGGYDPATWNASPAPRSPSACVTRITAQSADGVVFPSTVTTSTVLDGFQIANLRTTDAITAAVTVRGSTGAIINNNVINGGAGTSESHGVRIVDASSVAATPLITKNSIVGGTAPTAVGVSSLRSKPTIRDQCETFDATTGRCVGASCGTAQAFGANFIRGRAATANGTKTNAYGVYLDDSAGAVVETSGIASSECTANAFSTDDAAGVRVTGNADGTLIRADTIVAFQSGKNAVGIWADDCSGGSSSNPLWVLDNERVTGNSPATSCLGDGIRAAGNCHPRIDSNALIRGGEEGSASPANGVHCTTVGGVASRCTVLNNTLIEGSGSGFPPIAAGVRCDDGACARIERNTITGRAGIQTFGVALGTTDVVIARNVIDAGCAAGTGGLGAGIDSVDSLARIENNVVRGVTCANTTPAVNSWAVRATLGSSANEVDVHSNTLLAMGGPAACTSVALELLGGSVPRGLFRNNILHAGFCNTTYAVREASAGSDPRVFVNNDLWYSGTAPTALYRDEASTNLTTASAVNAVVDPTGTSNISANPLLQNPQTIAYPFPATPDYHLRAASACIDAGTSSGAPAGDFDFPATPRPSNTGFDIGADERP